MSELIVSVSGVRGIIGDSLTPDNIIKFTSAFAEYCRKHSKSKRIVVGRDGRLHGDVIANIVLSNLTLMGFQVVNIGIVPTPTVQIAAEKTHAAGGIAITASHNPQMWNGLKFLNSNGEFLDGKQIAELKEIASEGNFRLETIKKLRPVIDDNTWIKKHIDLVLSQRILRLKKIRERNFKVVVDTVNSAGSVIIPMLLRRLGCRVIEIFCNGSGIFPHTPEPIPENLEALSRMVVKRKADLGIAIDPDSDRLVIIDENGKPFGEENTIVTVVRYILRNTKGSNKNVTVNLSTTRAVDRNAKLYGGKVFRSPVGEINVVKEMKRNGSIIGGEGSGGVIYPKVHYGRDAIAGAAIILQELASFGGEVSEYKNEISKFYISKAKIKSIKNPDAILNAIVRKYTKKDCKISTKDGVKLDFENHWVHIRKSNTEPILRIITEAEGKKETGKLQNEFLKEVKKMV
ncbi:MAG TPA: phosphoglucosamine mutase [Ignavibacteria bacterium]|jgi:phosphomannomutase